MSCPKWRNMSPTKMPNSKCNLKIRILKSSIFAEHSSISGHTSLSLMHLYLKPRLRKKLVSYKGSSNLLLALCKANSRKHHDDTQGNIVHRRCMNSGTARCVFNIKNVSRLRMLKESWLVICQIIKQTARLMITLLACFSPSYDLDFLIVLH